MQVGITGAPPWLSIGWLIALLVVILCIVFFAIGQLEPRLALLIGGAALARML
jgi:hypothetical protein